MKPSRIIEILSGILPYLTVFLVSLFVPYDTDLGWHLKYGEYFFKHRQILRDNIFSSEMPTFHWVNSSWLTDLISYATFNNFGFLGLAVLGAIVISLTFYFFAKAAKLDYFEKALIFPLLIYFLSPLNSVSFRGQLLSLLLLGLLTYILVQYQNVILEHVRFTQCKRSDRISHLTGTKKIGHLYSLPPIFVLWSNIHGQFILGLVVLAIWIASNIVSQFWQSDFKNLKEAIQAQTKVILTFFACAAAVLLNPFGLGVYREAFRHFGNPLGAYIVEWVPFKMLSTPWWGQVVAGFTVFFGILFLIFSNKINQSLGQISIASIVYLLSFSVRRFVWPMYYLIVPLLAPVAAFFKPGSKKYAKISATVIFAIYLALTFMADNPLKHIENLNWQTYCQRYIQCPDGAINYLKNKLDIIDPEGLRPEQANSLNAPPAGEAGRLLTYYGWGGYIIWNYPEIKPSIDGRMHLWRDNSGYSAFEDYYAYEQDISDIEKSSYDVVLMSPEKPLYNRLNQLVDAGKWQKPYEDQDAGVFVRNN